MHHIKVIKDVNVNNVVKEQLVDGVQYVDNEPHEGSLNGITSDAVAKVAGDVGDVKDVIPEDTTEENPLVNETGLGEVAERVTTAEGDIDSIEEKIPSGASSSNKLVTESDLEAAQDSWQSGFTPKGEATVSQIDALTTQSNGDQYIVTDSGTITAGSVAVVAGDTVAWDSENAVWYKVTQYAKASEQATLTTYAQNVAHSLAQEYNGTTGAVAGKLYMNGGVLYKCNENTSGDFDSSKFEQVPIKSLLSLLYTADALNNIVLPLSVLDVTISNVQGEGFSRTCDIEIKANTIYWAGGFTAFSNTTFEGVRYNYTGIYAVISKKTRAFLRLAAYMNSTSKPAVPSSIDEVYLPIVILANDGIVNYRCDSYRKCYTQISAAKNKSYNCVALSDIDISFTNVAGSGNSRTCTVKFNKACTIVALGGNYIKTIAANTEIANCQYVYGGLYYNVKTDVLVPYSLGNTNAVPNLGDGEFIFPVAQWYLGKVNYACYRYTSGEIKEVSKAVTNGIIYEDVEKQVEGNIQSNAATSIVLNDLTDVVGSEIELTIDIVDASGFCALSWNGQYTSGDNYIRLVYFSGTVTRKYTLTVPKTAKSLNFWTAAANISIAGTATLTLYRKCIDKRLSELEPASPISPALTIPKKMYVVCNDIGDSDENARDYAIKMFADHLVRGVSEHIEPKFNDGKVTKDLYSKLFRASNAINTTAQNTSVDVATETITDNIIISKAEKYPVSFSLVSTRNKATENKICRLLCIGDSVTEGYLSSWGKPYANAPASYWSWIKMLFESDKIQNGNSGFYFESLGNINTGNFDIDFDGVQETGVKAYACGVGGSDTADWLSSLVEGRTNPFYDPVAQKFSLQYWVENYRTLIVGADGKTTRCNDSNKGALVTDVNTSNVCEPTHVLIQLGYNQSYSSAGTTRTNYLNGLRTMINTIIAEYPTVKVLLSLPDCPCAYNVQEFKQFLTSAVTKDNFDASQGQAKSWHDSFAFMNLDLMDLESEYSGEVIYVPSYFAMPSVLAGCCKNVPDLSFLSNKNPLMDGYVLRGASPLLHPGNAGHASIGYAVYATLKNDLYNQT